MTTTTEVRDDQIPPEVLHRRWYILGVLCTSLLVIVLANTAMNVALPTMARDLGLSASAQQWVVDAYSLVFAGLLFTAGTLGDRFGRKRFLQTGLVLLLSSLPAQRGSTVKEIVPASALTLPPST